MKHRDPSSKIKAEGALRQRVIRDKTKEAKADRVKRKAELKKEVTND